MIRQFRSKPAKPFERGREFGAVHATQIRETIAVYRRMFEGLAGSRYDMTTDGHAALAATAAFAAPLHEEMLGLAEGAGIDPALIGTINARTEILAKLKAKELGECSVMIHAPADSTPPTAVQTWDWYCDLRDQWLVWDIPLADGTVTKTMTEYGIVGKAGLNTRGLGLLFTILHHKYDGQRIGVPVHVAARWALDTGGNIADAAQLLGRADVSASSSMNLVSYDGKSAAAIAVELFPGGPGLVLPDERGWLVHTNHFLAEAARPFDTEPTSFPDTQLRHNLLTRRSRMIDRPSTDAVLAAMASHLGGDAAVCCHHNPKRDPAGQYETLATVIADVAAGDLKVLSGGPCQGKAV